MSAYLSQNRDIFVIGEFETSRDMIRTLVDQPVDVLLIDYSLGPTEVDGISLIKMLRIKFPDARILVFSALYDPATVALALRPVRTALWARAGAKRKSCWRYARWQRAVPTAIPR